MFTLDVQTRSIFFYFAKCRSSLYGNRGEFLEGKPFMHGSHKVMAGSGSGGQPGDALMQTEEFPAHSWFGNMWGICFQLNSPLDSLFPLKKAELCTLCAHSSQPTQAGCCDHSCQPELLWEALGRADL